QQLRPQYKPVFELSVVQPLLQNFGWDFSYLVVRVAEQTAEASFYTYKAQLTDFVELVIEAYWNIVGARANLAVQRASKALADRSEIQPSAHGVTAQMLNERIAGNALLPRLDLVGSYGQNGLSGTNRPFARPSTILSQTDLTNSSQFPGAKCEQLPSGNFLC